uniref:Transmembrane protein n=1 Tax=Melanthalia intermedia TaxID=172989 RepID=A0A345UAH1_9FLOR|nr:hypothetical protein [Melanthalia intermedia]AXI97457.1 hypothetical protein [Melanthalia intermedia]
MRLNHQVAHLFAKTRFKFRYDLSNQTGQYLYIDILSNSVKHKLFSIVLVELEILILDLIELNLSIQVLRLLNSKILYDLVQKSIAHFLLEFSSSVSPIALLDSKNYYYLQIVLLEHRWLLEILLNYLVFGCVCMDNYVFPFAKIHTPVKHVAIFLENFVIQASNIVIFMILENFQSLPQIIYFLRTNNLSCSSCISMRSLAFFRNSLIYQNLFCFHIGQPKSIYANRYKVWLISSNGLISKYIHLFRLDDLRQLSSAKLALISFVEFQDLIIPKLENSLFLLARLLLYIFVNIIGNGIVFCIRVIIFIFQSL